MLVFCRSALIAHKRDTRIASVGCTSHRLSIACVASTSPARRYRRFRRSSYGASHQRPSVVTVASVVSVAYVASVASTLIPSRRSSHSASHQSRFKACTAAFPGCNTRVNMTRLSVHKLVTHHTAIAINGSLWARRRTATHQTCTRRCPSAICSQVSQSSVCGPFLPTPTSLEGSIPRCHIRRGIPHWPAEATLSAGRLAHRTTRLSILGYKPLRFDDATRYQSEESCVTTVAYISHDVQYWRQ